METKNLDLEQIVILANKIGLEYAAAKERLERLELMKPVVKARITQRLDDGKMTETKLKRLTDVDLDYLEFIDELVKTKGETESLRIRYESYKNLFDAKRSMLSFQKAEMKLL